MWYLINRLYFFTVCALMDHKNDCSWSFIVYAVTKQGRFFFYNNMENHEWKECPFVERMRQKENLLISFSSVFSHVSLTCNVELVLRLKYLPRCPN